MTKWEKIINNTLADVDVKWKVHINECGVVGLYGTAYRWADIDVRSDEEGEPSVECGTARFYRAANFYDADAESQDLCDLSINVLEYGHLGDGCGYSDAFIEWALGAFGVHPAGGVVFVDDIDITDTEGVPRAELAASLVAQAATILGNDETVVVGWVPNHIGDHVREKCEAGGLFAWHSLLGAKPYENVAVAVTE